MADQNQLRIDLKAAIERRGWHAMVQSKGRAKARFFRLAFIEASTASYPMWHVWTCADGDSYHEIDALPVALDRVEEALRSLIKEAKTSLGGLEAQEVTCKNCGERKPRSKICGHCAEDL